MAKTTKTYCETPSDIWIEKRISKLRDYHQVIEAIPSTACHWPKVGRGAAKNQLKKWLSGIGYCSWYAVLCPEKDELSDICSINIQVVALFEKHKSVFIGILLFQFLNVDLLPFMCCLSLCFHYQVYLYCCLSLETASNTFISELSLKNIFNPNLSKLDTISLEDQTRQGLKKVDLSNGVKFML